MLTLVMAIGGFLATYWIMHSGDAWLTRNVRVCYCATLGALPCWPWLCTGSMLTRLLFAVVTAAIVLALHYTLSRVVVADRGHYVVHTAHTMRAPHVAR